jgi:D-beta-D-heptose 7-phosphate kinase/D-beta-D-heptose 1-phosphate adenosyltransferase
MIKVYGDIMLDRWIMGNASRISPEAPVPVLQETEQKFCPGGAGNLALNIASLNGHIGVYGSIAPDREGYRIIDCFEKLDNISFNATVDHTITTTKNRLVGQSGQHIMRWDREEQYTGVEALHRLLNDLSEDDIVCVSDYAKGTIRPQTTDKILKRGCKVLVDPKQDPDFYENVYLVKPNMSEYVSWFGPFDKDKARTHMREYNWKNLVVTDGSNGMYVLTDDNEFAHIKEPAQEVADVVGAGDTVLAVIAYMLDEGHDLIEACKVACYAAARAVEHRGVHIVTHDDLRRQVVFTNGVFDILHTGHLKLLEYAKSRGKKLVVGINTDASVQRLKGANRPINDVQTRQAQLEALPWVDEVVTFTEDTPENLLKTVNPDLIIKGGDYTIETVVGHKDYAVEIFPTVNGQSTTKIIESMK